MCREKIYRGLFVRFFGIVLCVIFLGFPRILMAQQKMVSIATGGSGGVFYVIGGAMANILSKKIPDIKSTAEVTAGSLANGVLVGSKKVELGLIVSDDAYMAYKGLGKFSKKIPVRQLMSLYPNNFQMVTLEKSGINSVKGLRGKKISLGPPMSGAEVKGAKLLEINGIDLTRDVKNDRLSVAEQANALKDGKIDASFWVGGVPAGAILDLSATPGIKIKIVDLGDSLPGMQAYIPVYYKRLIPKGTYTGVDYDVNTIALDSLLICLEDMDEKLAYQITKTILENLEDLHRVHSEAKSITLKNASTPSPIPFHPGAIRYFKEKGITIQ